MTHKFKIIFIRERDERSLAVNYRYTLLRKSKRFRLFGAVSSFSPSPLRLSSTSHSLRPCSLLLQSIKQGCGGNEGEPMVKESGSSHSSKHPEFASPSSSSLLSSKRPNVSSFSFLGPGILIQFLCSDGWIYLDASGILREAPMDSSSKWEPAENKEECLRSPLVLNFGLLSYVSKYVWKSSTK